MKGFINSLFKFGFLPLDILHTAYSSFLKGKYKNSILSLILASTLGLVWFGAGLGVLLLGNEIVQDNLNILQSNVHNENGFSLFNDIFPTDEDLVSQAYLEYVDDLNNDRWEQAHGKIHFLYRDDYTISDMVDDENILRTEYAVVKRLIEINKIHIDNNIAYIDRTMHWCKDIDCNSRESTRGFVKIVKEGTTWFFAKDQPLYCIRKTPIEINPEFQRAISLIKQRISEGSLPGSEEFVEDIENFENCLNIRYATNQNELANVEGYFEFSQSLELNNLDIYVSPQYKQQDDLITSMLLVHEITHARNHVLKILYGINKDCMENEAEAFSNQLLLSIHNFNPSEVQSLLSRMSLSNDPTLNRLVNTFNAILYSDEITYYEKALKYVKSDPYYQHQCNQ